MQMVHVLIKLNVPYTIANNLSRNFCDLNYGIFLFSRVDLWKNVIVSYERTIVKKGTEI